MNINTHMADMCTQANVTMVCAVVLTARGTFQLAAPLGFRQLCQEAPFRESFVQSIARCLDALTMTPMDDLTIYRSHEQNGGPQE